MAIFTPESKFLNMMKTTLNTNKYFVENTDMGKYKKKEDLIKNKESSPYTYNSNKDFEDESEIGVISTGSAEIEISDSYTGFVDETETNLNKLISFSEQQIKVNKQTKNNYDRLNKKITVNTEKIEKKIVEIEEDIWRRLLDHEQVSKDNYLAIIEKIDDYKKDIRDKYIKVLAFIGFGILSNLILFAYLSLK